MSKVSVLTAAKAPGVGESTCHYPHLMAIAANKCLSRRRGRIHTPEITDGDDSGRGCRRHGVSFTPPREGLQGEGREGRWKGLEGEGLEEGRWGSRTGKEAREEEGDCLSANALLH